VPDFDPALMDVPCRDFNFSFFGKSFEQDADALDELNLVGKAQTTTSDL
jgi:hypothetical protein